MGDMQLKPELVQELCAFARERKIQKLMIFGSRARGDNRPKSDIDLAVQGGDVAGFTDDVNEKARTLLTWRHRCFPAFSISVLAAEPLSAAECLLSSVSPRFRMSPVHLSVFVCWPVRRFG